MFYSVQWYSNTCKQQYELTVLLPQQHNGFQTSLILKVLPAICGSLFWYLPKLFHLHDPASIIVTVCKSIFCFSCWKLLNYWNLAGRDWERVSCHANRIAIGFGVLPVEVLAYMYQVAKVSAANWVRDFYLLILDLTEYWV